MISPQNHNERIYDLFFYTWKTWNSASEARFYFLKVFILPSWLRGPAFTWQGLWFYRTGGRQPHMLVNNVSICEYWSTVSLYSDCKYWICRKWPGLRIRHRWRLPAVSACHVWPSKREPRTHQIDWHRELVSSAGEALPLTSLQGRSFIYS